MSAIPIGKWKDEKHDLDGTPLPEGHEQYTADQERFDVLWQKHRDGTATIEEQNEMIRMQIDYWNQ